ncbi:hypothetical protein [Larkinella soli]|uniref:hypothetical protein n=1 Tax=Larkinella soli TaxID=1770527 RepID=UPI000FFBCF13|nr:hypothetical protein [Larkinella soli]
MLLEVLLATLAFGIACFIVGRYWEEKIANRPRRAPRPPKPTRKRIEKDLDQLLHLYQQGFLSEAEFQRLADELMDEFNGLVTDRPGGRG